MSKRTQLTLQRGLESTGAAGRRGPAFAGMTDDDDERMEEELRELDAARPDRPAPRVLPKAGAAADAPPKHSLLIKLLMLGDSGVGKTTLLKRYAEGKFDPMIASTAGVAYETQYVELEGRNIRVDIWDTAGQERFHVITQAYYAGAHGIVLAYDASEAGETSFNNIRYWMNAIREHADAHCVKVLLGNKVDKAPKAISHARGKAVADEYGVGFFETSAKSGANVTEAFHSVARECVLKALAEEGVSVSTESDAEVLAAAATASKGKGKRCAVM